MIKLHQMLAAIKFAEKIKNNFIKAIELLKLKFAKKHLAIFCAVFIFVGIGLIIPQGAAHGGALDTVGDWLMRNVLFRIVYAIFYVLFYAAYAISWIGASILNTNLNPEIMTQVLKSSAITDGWAIFRDIANLFFILILLFIAIGTIVRSQSYNLKSLLPKLIIAVFLINFSAVIAKVIIDFGNIFMYGVLKWMSCPGKEECFTDFFSSLMTTVRVFWDRYQLKDFLLPTAQDTIGLVVATIYTFLYGLILVALGTFLMIRIAAFALLIILSPLAFIGEVFPGMKELSSEWWKNLVNYTLFGPIFALLLYVSGLMARTVIEAPVTDSFYTDPALGTFGTLYVTIIQNIIPLIFLLAIIPVTQKLGIAGANAVFSSSIGFGTAGVRFAGGAIDRYLARGATMTGKGKGAWVRRQAAYLSPGAWRQAFKAHKAEAEHDYDVAGGKIRTKAVERVTDWPTRKGLAKSGVDYEQREQDKTIERKRKDITGKESTDEIIHKENKAYDKGDNEEAIADVLEIALKGDTDDYLQARGKNNTPEDLIALISERYAPKIGDKRADLLLEQIKELEKKANNKSYEVTYWDKKEERVKRRDIFNPNPDPENPGKTIGGVEHEKMLEKQADSFFKEDIKKALLNLNRRTLFDQVKTGESDKEGKPIWKWVMAERGKKILTDNRMTDQYLNRLNEIKGRETQTIRDVMRDLPEDIAKGLVKVKFSSTETDRLKNFTKRLESAVGSGEGKKTKGRKAAEKKVMEEDED